jgi:hypothetical protein
VAERCKKELELSIDSNKRKIEEWEDSIKKFHASIKEERK